MKRITIGISMWLVVSLLLGVVQAQPTFDLRFETIPAGDRVLVTILLKNDEGSIPLGTSRLVFTYNDAALSFAETPVTGIDYRFLRFDNADLSSYGPGTVAHTALSGPDQITLNITLASTKGGTVVERTFMEVAQLTFGVLDRAVTPNLIWNGSATQMVGSDDVIWQAGALTNDTETILSADQTIPFVAGWNWFSLNQASPDSDITAVLSRQGRLVGTTGDLIKSQAQFSLYEPSLTQWIGTLTMLTPGPTYQIKIANTDTLYVNGDEANRSGQIALASGWNWIGYLPQQTLALNDALSLMTTIQTNDLIKSQVAFAQYLEGVGWLGSLTHMEPGLGYLIRVAQAGSLDYPDPSSFTQTMRVVSRASLSDERQQISDLAPDHVLIGLNLSRFPYSMNVIATVEEITCDDGSVAIYAYSGTERRGAASLQFVPALNEHRAFLTVYGEALEGEEVKLILQSDCLPAVESLRLSFEADAVVGGLKSPLVLSTENIFPEQQVAPESIFHAYPNPFIEAITIEYTLPQTGPVRLTLYDLLGREVAILVDEVQATGMHRLSWQDETLAPGAYVYRFIASGNTTSNTLIFAPTRER